MSQPKVSHLVSPRKEISRAPLLVPENSCGNSRTFVARRAPSEAQRLFIDFIELFLDLGTGNLVGFQAGFESVPDQILFTEKHGSTLAVPVSVLLEPRHVALEIVQRKKLDAEERFRASEPAVLAYA